MKLENKVAIVTGGSRGIGKAISKRFAGDGARLVVNYRDDADAAGELVDDIRAAGGEAISVQADVSRRPDTDRLCASTLEAFGVIDILVSNAGIIIDRPYIESTDDDWQSAMDTNLRGFFNVTQSVLPHMIDRKYGRIIATGSIINEVADFGGNKYSVCAASKGGIHGMLRPIAPRWQGTASRSTPCLPDTSRPRCSKRLMRRARKRLFAWYRCAVTVNLMKSPRQWHFWPRTMPPISRVKPFA